MNTFGIVGMVVTIVLGFLLFSCQTSKPTIAAENKVLLYELERTGCLGDCPVFRMQVYTNRMITVIPRRGLNLTDQTSDTLSESEFSDLQSSMVSLHDAQLDSSYDNRVVDAPFAIIRLIEKDKTHTIRCRGDEPPAFALGVQALENLAIKRGWMQGSAKMAQPPKKELIIELGDQSDVPPLEEKYKQLWIEIYQEDQSSAIILSI